MEEKSKIRTRRRKLKPRGGYYPAGFYKVGLAARGKLQIWLLRFLKPKQRQKEDHLHNSGRQENKNKLTSSDKHNYVLVVRPGRHGPRERRYVKQ